MFSPAGAGADAVMVEPCASGRPGRCRAGSTHPDSCRRKTEATGTCAQAVHRRTDGQIPASKLAHRRQEMAAGNAAVTTCRRPRYVEGAHARDMAFTSKSSGGASACELRRASPTPALRPITSEPSLPYLPAVHQHVAFSGHWTDARVEGEREQ